MKKKLRVLILGSGGSPGINFIKALQLSKQPLYIVGTDVNKFFLELAPVDTKYVIRHQDEQQFVRDIIRIVKKERIDFIHSQPEEEVRILSKHAAEIPARMFFPDIQTIDIFQDKWKTHLALSAAGIPVAESVHLSGERSLQDTCKRYTGKTLWIRATKGAGGKASLPVTSYEQALMWIRYWFDKGLSWDDFVASDYLPGKEVSWLSLWKEGTLICSQQKERYQWVQANISPSGVGGTTAIQRTTHYERANQIGYDTIRAVDPQANGVFVVDMKENVKGVPCVTEVNVGRFFTTSLFFAAAGVNMPYIYVCLGMGLPIPHVAQYNAVEKDLYWIRVPDGGPVMIKEGNWTSHTL